MRWRAQGMAQSSMCSPSFPSSMFGFASFFCVPPLWPFMALARLAIISGVRPFIPPEKEVVSVLTPACLRACESEVSG